MTCLLKALAKTKQSSTHVKLSIFFRQAQKKKKIAFQNELPFPPSLANQIYTYTIHIHTSQHKHFHG